MTGRILLKVLGWLVVVASIAANVGVGVEVVRHPQLLIALQQPAAPATTTATVVSHTNDSLTVKTALGQTKTVTLSAKTPIGFVSTNPEVPAGLPFSLPASIDDLATGAAVTIVEAPTFAHPVTSVQLLTDTVVIGQITNITADQLTVANTSDQKSATEKLTLKFGSSVQAFELHDINAPLTTTKLTAQSDLVNGDIVLVRTDRSPTDAGATVTSVMRLPRVTATK